VYIIVSAIAVTKGPAASMGMQPPCSGSTSIRNISHTPPVSPAAQMLAHHTMPSSAML